MTINIDLQNLIPDHLRPVSKIVLHAGRHYVLQDDQGNYLHEDPSRPLGNTNPARIELFGAEDLFAAKTLRLPMKTIKALAKIDLEG